MRLKNSLPPKLALPLLCLAALVACAADQTVTASAKATQPPQAVSAAVTLSPTSTQLSPTITAQSSATPSPEAAALAVSTPRNWQSMPIVPEGVSQRVKEIYQKGLAMGNDPNAFSKVGDCESSAEWFLGDFDKGAEHYSLGKYADLEGAITQFQGSFNRRSLAAERSFTTASELSSIWANPDLCQSGETPLECEYRIHKPSYALIMLGTNEALSPVGTFEKNLRQILDLTEERGIVPILTTKADNLEGNGAINEVIARLAGEYEIPLWNFWAAVQPLPDGGLQEDGAHLTYAGNRFNDPDAMQHAWPVRNLTALQALDAVWRATSGKPH